MQELLEQQRSSYTILLPNTLFRYGHNSYDHTSCIQNWFMYVDRLLDASTQQT